MENFLDMFGAYDAQRFAVIFLTFLVAGVIKGVIGLGLPTVAVGILGMVMPPMEAAALLIVPSLVTNVWQLASGGHLGALARRLWPMAIGICAGTWIGGALLGPGAAGRATMTLGIALVMYAALGLSPLRFSIHGGAEPWLSPVMGAATGAVTAATGVFVIPAVPFLQAIELDKDELVQAMGMAFTVSTLALAASLAFGGMFRPTAAGMSLLALPPAIGGMYLGQWIRARVSVPMFRICFFLGLMGMGVHLALRGSS